MSFPIKNIQNDASRQTSYSSPAKEFYAVVPANSQDYSYASTAGSFRLTRLGQRDILPLLQDDPVEIGHLAGLYDVSISDVLNPYKESVGIMKNKEGCQTGSCSLITDNMAMIPCHCIEGMDVRDLKATFGFALENEEAARTYQVSCIIEYDPDLDYAIVQFEGEPGKNHGPLQLKSSYSLTSQEPALLHHPLNKPLKVSVHTFIQTNYHQNYYSTFHDSDYGSSGGAYVDPAGVFVAMHLGSERNHNTMNLQRLALPIEEIIARNPNSIISCLANAKGLPQNTEVYEIPYIPRFFIDLEKYEDSKKEKQGDCFIYRLRKTEKNLPKVILDAHQGKHSPMPGPRSGGRGKKGTTQFKDFTIDDTITLAEYLMTGDKVAPYLNAFMDDRFSPPTITYEIEKDDKKKFGNELYKKLNKNNVCAIQVSLCFDKTDQRWDMHFSPTINKNK